MHPLLSSPQTALEHRGINNLWPLNQMVLADFSCLRPTGKLTNIGHFQNYPVPTHEQTLAIAKYNVGGLKFSITPKENA